MKESDKLYKNLESTIITWVISEDETAGELTRSVLRIIGEVIEQHPNDQELGEYLRSNLKDYFPKRG